MKNHWLKKNEEKIEINPMKHWNEPRKCSPAGPVFSHRAAECLMGLDKEEEAKQLSTVEIVGDSITFEGDNIVLKGDVTIVGNLTVDGNLTITDCMEVCSENEVSITNCTIDGGMTIADRVGGVSVIDCTFSSPPIAIIPPEEETISSPMEVYNMIDCIIKDIRVVEDKKAMDTIMEMVA